MTSPSPGSPGPSSSGSDWPAEVAGRIESVVGAVRDKTTIPVLKGAQAVVYGFLLGVLGTIILILGVIGIIRLLDDYLPIHPVGRRIWIVDAATAAIFLAMGAFAWHRRRPRRA